jgi:hypothetical protein
MPRPVIDIGGPPAERTGDMGDYAGDVVVIV